MKGTNIYTWRDFGSCTTPMTLTYYQALEKLVKDELLFFLSFGMATEVPKLTHYGMV